MRCNTGRSRSRRNGGRIGCRSHFRCNLSGRRHRRSHGRRHGRRSVADPEMSVWTWNLTRDQARQSLIHDLQIAMEDNNTADLIVNVNWKNDVEQFHVHRAILAARSPVFRAMLSSGMLERDQQSITINDISPEVFRALLCYLYTSDSAALPSLALELFSAADKYEVVELKEESAQSIMANLSVDNVCVALVLADMHCDDLLKSVADNFIDWNLAAVRRTNAFKSLKKSHPQLVAKFRGK